MPNSARVVSVSNTDIPNMVVIGLQDPRLQDETHGYMQLPNRPFQSLMYEGVPVGDRLPYPVAISFGLRTGAITSIAIPAARLWRNDATIQRKLARILGDEAITALIQGEELVELLFSDEVLLVHQKLFEMDRVTSEMVDEAIGVYSTITPLVDA